MTMSTLQLRHHIPISAPARREPADGKESAMRVSLGFDPGWFHRRCAVDFSERWHTDPRYRHDTLVRMKQELCRTFPQVTYWDVRRSDDLWTISGAYGAYFMPAVLGCRLQFAPARWPVIIARPAMSLEEFVKLDVRTFLNAPAVEDLFRQMDIIEQEGGRIHGYLGWQGVLNNAFNVRGESIFVEMADTPELADRFFALICETMITLMQMVQERQRRSGFYINQGDVSNCVMNMIAPRLYGARLRQYDERIALSFERFGVHTCNWDVTPYLDELSKLPKMGYLDMGIMSDMRRVRDMFPEARRAVMYSPVKFHEASFAELRSDMQRIYEDLAPCDVVVADIHPTTPDGRVHEVLQICRDLETQGVVP